MTQQIIGKLRSAIDRVAEDPRNVFIILFILVLTYLLFSATFYQDPTIFASWGSLSNAFYLLAIGVALNFLSPNEARFFLKRTYAFLLSFLKSTSYLLFCFFFVLAGSLFIACLHPLQTPLEIANILAFYLLVASVVGGLLSYLTETKEDKSRHRKIKIGHFKDYQMTANRNKGCTPFKGLERLMFKTGSLLPLTYFSSLRHLLENGTSSILDVGCGKGESFITVLNQHKKYYTVGIDLFPPYLKMAKTKGTHSDYLQCDVRFLPFRKDSIDTVICLEIMEHLKKKRALAALEAIEDIARFQVILTMPIGFYHQDEYDGNPLQSHKSHWVPSELKNLGFKVRGNGLRPLYINERMLVREHGLRHLGILARPLTYISFLVSYILRPLVYFYPSLGDHMICVKSS